MKKYVLLIFIVLSALFFYRSFTGDAIQGNKQVSDSPLGVARHYSRMIGNTTGNWIDYEQIGHTAGNIQINMFTLYSYLLPVGMVLGASYFTALLFSLIFGYLFLSKLKLDPLLAVFGSAAYAFSPSVLSYIYAGHVQVVCSLSYVPAIFYFLAMAFDPEENKLVKTLVMSALGAIFLGLMFADEPQRGVYFLILSACFVLYRIYVRNKLSPKALLDMVKALIIPAVFMLVIISGSAFLLQALNQRIALQSSSVESAQSADNAWNFAVSYSMHPLELIDSLAFGLHGQSSLEPDQYYWGSKEFSSSCDSLGFFILIFALMGSIAYYKKSSLVRFFVFGGVISLLLSFGRFWPGMPFFWLFYHLPLMSNFRDPIKILCVSAFCLSMLSAFGLKYFIENAVQNIKSEGKFSIIEKVTAIALCAGVIALVIVMAASGDIALGFNLEQKYAGMGQTITGNIIMSLVRMDIFIALTLAIAVASSRMKKFTGLADGALISAAFFILLIIDLWSIDLYYVDKSYIKMKDFYGQDNSVAFLRDAGKKEQFRVITSLMLPGKNGTGNLLITSRANREQYLTFWFSFYDIAPMEVVASSAKDQELENFFNSMFERSRQRQISNVGDLLNMNLPLLRITGVKYLVTDGYLYLDGGFRKGAVLAGSLTNSTNFSFSSLGASYDGSQGALFELTNYVPRLSFFDSFVTVANNGEALKYLSDPGFNYLGGLVVNAPVSGRGDGTKGLFKKQTVTSYRDWDIKADVEAPPAGGVLLYNMRFAPGWKAFIDGKGVPVYRADYILMAVFVDGGSHKVEFRYDPDRATFYISFITVISGFLFAIVYGIFLLFSKKGKNSMDRNA
jgi:hypothetical protein